MTTQMFRRLPPAVTAAALAGLLLVPGVRPDAAAQGKDDAPAALAMVPGDALGFAHVRLADLWAHDLMKTLRDTVAAAGPDALAAFKKQVYPDPATLDRATVIVLPPAGGQGEPGVVGVIGFKEPFDKDKLRALYLPNAAGKRADGRTYFVGEKGDVAIAFPDDRHLLIGPPAAVGAFLARPAADGPMTAAAKAAGGKALTVVVNVKALPIPPQAFEQVPENVRPLLRADRVTLTLDLAAADPVLEVRAGYADTAAASDALKALKAAAAMAKGALAQPREELRKKLFEKADEGPRPIGDLPELAAALAGLGGMKQLDALLDNPPVRTAGSDLAASVTIPKEMTAVSGTYTAVMIGLLLPAVQKVREAAGRTQGANNLKQIALAFHNYEAAYGKLPGNVYSKAGKPLLSWRVAILPFIEQDALYRQFKLDEPWDSDHNKKLIPQMPKIYTIPGAKPPEPGKTFYQGFVGAKGARVRPVFVDAPGAEARFAGITDGTSNTILVAEAADAVEWTKPADLPFDPEKPLPKLGGHFAGGFNAALCDGSVRFITDAIDKAVLKALITANGGEVIPQW